MSEQTRDRPSPSPGLEVSEVRDGLVVYQEYPARVHYLNGPAAYVFELSTGRRTVPEISEEIRVAYGLPSSPLDLVVSCVEKLREQGVLT